MRQLTVSAYPLLWIRWEKLKKDQTEYSCLLFLNDVLCCVVTEFVYANTTGAIIISNGLLNTIILFNLGE